MQQYYTLNLAGLTRKLPLCKLNDKMQIASFVILGDAQLSTACATALLKKAPEYDLIVTAEAKGIPLAHEMARQAGDTKYIIARKSPKLYMTQVFEVNVRSITTGKEQFLYLDLADVEQMRGKRVLLIDDVISTGESLLALEKLMDKAEAKIVGRMAILAEGDAIPRADITYLAPLPLFDAQGIPLA